MKSVLLSLALLGQYDDNPVLRDLSHKWAEDRRARQQADAYREQASATRDAAIQHGESNKQLATWVGGGIALAGLFIGIGIACRRSPAK